MTTNGNNWVETGIVFDIKRCTEHIAKDLKDLNGNPREWDLRVRNQWHQFSKEELLQLNEVLTNFFMELPG